MSHWKQLKQNARDRWADVEACRKGMRRGDADSILEACEALQHCIDAAQAVSDFTGLRGVREARVIARAREFLGYAADLAHDHPRDSYRLGLALGHVIRSASYLYHYLLGIV